MVINFGIWNGHVMMVVMMVVVSLVVMMVMMVLNDSIGCDVFGGMTIVKVMMMVIIVIMVLRLQQVFPYLRSGFTRFSWWSPWAWSRW